MKKIAKLGLITLLGISSAGCTSGSMKYYYRTIDTIKKTIDEINSTSDSIQETVNNINNSATTNNNETQQQQNETVVENSNDAYFVSSDELDPKLSELIAKIEVVEEGKADYNRNDWTSSSQSYEFGGKKYNSIRKYAQVASTNVQNGVYIDPYTNQVLELKNADFDHLVPLHYVSNHGGAEWSIDEKQSFANNPTIGVNVNARDNRAKGDKGPSKWLPSENVKDYCYSWLVITSNYHLSIDRKDLEVIEENLKGTPITELHYMCQYN